MSKIKTFLEEVNEKEICGGRETEGMILRMIEGKDSGVVQACIFPHKT